MPIYTRNGDEGLTRLANGKLVTKDNIRVNLYGTLDELNCAIGFAIAQLNSAGIQKHYSLFLKIQHVLFDLGSELAAYKGSHKDGGVIRKQDIQDLEDNIDKMEKELSVMKNFILPGGSLSSGSIHLARSTCRRLEREMTKVLLEYKNDEERNKTDDEIIIKDNSYRYINRLSDYFFMAARYANHLLGISDIKWQKRDY